jgi:cytochrome c peroxidase
VGGRQFQKFGVFKDYWTLTGSLDHDEGRFLLTHQDADRFVFKVPGLRNVAMTPPYFHDGSVEELRSAIRIMGQTQLGQTLTEGEINAIEAFLNALTGSIPTHFAPLH